MTKNSLHAVEQNLRSIAKRYKSVKYSIGLAILFLMMGLSAFSEEVMSTQEIAASRENLRNSVESLQTKVSDARRENQKEIDGLRLELVKLMEQGNQVVKSPWASWQFGINYVYNSMSGMYKGRGDKPPKYVYNSIYRRGNWEERNALDVLAGKTVEGYPITPGNENTNTWQTATTPTGVAKLKRDTSIDASTIGKREWGLVELRKIREPLNEIEILARVSPKEVKKDKLDIPVSVTPPATLSAPVVNPNVNKPTEAPKVDLPTQPNLEIAQAPSINNNPEIKVLTVNKVGAITVNPSKVEPVDFALSAGDKPYSTKYRVWASKYNGQFDNNQSSPITFTTNTEYLMTWAVSNANTTFKNTYINVEATDARAIKVDEGLDNDEFTYDGGTIRLKKSQNAAIDIQGTHGGSLENPVDMYIYNKGTIIGEGGTNISKHAGISFNNFDASSDTSRVFFTNQGNIKMNAPTSAGMMLRPEINDASGGLNMQYAENESNITLNGRGSVGVTVVKNPNNTGFDKTVYKVKVPNGGLLASRADEANRSGILISKDGTIDILGDDSAGVSILNTIQEVKVNGNINIGVGDPTTLSGDGASTTLANRLADPAKGIVAGTPGKVEGSVGVYTEEMTRPVRGRTYAYDSKTQTEVVTDKYFDDHGRENTTNTTNGKYEENTSVVRHTGVTIGTETVEVGGTVTLGENSASSFGLRNEASGSITLVSGGKVVVEGENNYGALSNGSTYQRQVRKFANKDYTGVQETARIDINNNATITVTGKKSIGYAMLSGQGTNRGEITVTGNNTPVPGSTNYEGSLGFYGENGTFNNESTGKITTSGDLAHAVVVKSAGMTFNHSGTIEVDSPNSNKGNIGVFSDGAATVNFNNNSNVFVKANSVGIYSADKDKFNTTFTNHGKLNIEIGKDSTFAYLDGNATTTLKEFFVKNANGKAVSVNIKENMGANSSLVYANDRAEALLDADYTITKGDKNASTIALLAANNSRVTIANGKKLTTNTQVALAAVDGIVHPVGSTTVSGSTAENKGIIVSNRTNDGIGIYARDNGSEAINDGTITMNGTKAVGMYGQDITTFENKTGKSIEVKKEQSAGMYARVTGDNTLTAQNNGKIITNKQKSVGIYLKNDTTLPTGSINPAASKLIAFNKEIEIKGGTESIGIYAPASTVSRVGKVTMADTVTKSIAVYLSKGAQVTSVATDEINLGTSTKNIAYFIKNENTGFAASSVLGKVFGYGVGVYLEGDTTLSPTDVAKLTAASPDLNFKQGTATGDGIVGLYLKGNTDISTYNKTITVGNTVVDNKTKTDIAPAIGIYSEKQGTSLAAPYVVKANINTGTKAVGIFSAPDTPAVPPATPAVSKKSFIKYEGNQMTLGEGSTGFYVNGGTELASPTIDLNGGLVAYVTEGSTFKGGTATINLSKTGIGVYGERGAVVEVKNWIFNNKGNAAEEIRLKEGIAKVTTPKSLKPKMVLTHVINGETYLTSTVTAVADAGYTQEENIGLMAQGLKNTKVGITWDKGNDYEIINEGTIDFTTSNKSTAIYAESARVKNDGTIKLGESSTGIYGIYRDDSPKFKDNTNVEYPNKLEINTTANSNISLKNGSTGMYLVNAQRLDTAAGGTIQSVAGETNNVGIYAINGVVDVPTTGTPAEIAEANAYNNKNTNFKSLTMTNNSNITLGNGSVGIYTRGQSDTLRNTVTNEGNITVGDTLAGGAPAVGIYAENTNLTQGDTGTPNITVGKKGIALYGKNSTVEAKGTVNYSNKGILGYFENSTFTSHYGDLTAHQNTILFLKNSTANMNGAGTPIDITVPDKAATSDSFAGVYVEGTSTLNGVKKITVGENSNGIFMKDATFTSNVTDIESTKEGAKGLLAVESDLTNNSKITLSGDSSIGIYSDASNAKTVTNNGKLTIAGKKTLGVFLKGSQTFINKADIDVADTTSSVPAEKTVGIYTKDGTSTIKHNSGTINVGTKSIGIFSATNSGVEVDTPAKINIKDEAIGIYKEKGTALLKGEIDVAAHTSTTKNSEPVGLYGLNGADITDSASKITVGAKSFGFILENETPATTNKYTSTGAGTVSLGDDSVFLYSNGQASLTNRRDISSNSDRVIGFYIKGNATNRGDLTNNATIDFSNSKGSIGIYAPGGKATNKGRILVGETDSIDPATGLVYSDVSKITYGIGMAADNGGHIINDNEIRVYGDKSIGMYGKGTGTKVENNGTIFLDGSRATDTNKIQSMVGVYVDEGATFINKGTIRTADAYAGKIVNGVQKVNNNVVGLVGVAVMNGSTLENHGNIDIDADESFGVVVRNSVIKNYGNFKINVRGRGTYGVSYKDISAADLAALEAEVNSKLKSDPRGQELAAAGGVNKSYEGVSITIQNGKPIFTRNGVTVSDAEVE